MTDVRHSCPFSFTTLSRETTNPALPRSPVDLLRGPVVGAHDEAVVVHVEDDVLAHDGQPDEGDVGDGLGHLDQLFDLGAVGGHDVVVVGDGGRLVVAAAAGSVGGAEADSH